MSVQLWALAVVGVVVLAAACLEILRARIARRKVVGTVAAPASDPYILYFTGEGCTVCRTHQEPALAKLGAVRIDKVDAVADRTLADRFNVYTLPTTVVMSRAGHALHATSGYPTPPNPPPPLPHAPAPALHP